MVSSSSIFGQTGGDQMLDGIGESALVARYPFSANERDTTRNTHHASLQGTGGTYVDDQQFGRVLSLPGGRGAYVRIPGAAFDGLDTISVSGWVFLKSDDAAQRFFDFGRGTGTNFFTSAGGVGINRTGLPAVQGSLSPRESANKWAHVVVVLNASAKTLTAYVDGQRAGQVTGVNTTMEQLMDQDDGAANRAFIGRSQDDNDATLNGLLHDFRIYTIALSDQQVATIHRNGMAGRDSSAAVAEANTNQPAKVKGIAQPMVSELTGVADVKVETPVGSLPRLPYTVAGVYKGNAKGPEVRVIWPSPNNNEQVRQAGTYELTGKVPGTTFTAKAVVTVSENAKQEPLPQRQLEPFPLGDVILMQDEHERDTQFIKNRDKFVKTMADTNPDNFLYMFRNAFGQPQPEGAKALGGWDDERTRLRGHATGHYLSAIAQAYASTSYDRALHDNFHKKMDYLIDTLYALSKKSGVPTNEGGEFNADPTKVPFGPGRTNYDSDLSAANIRTDYWMWGKGFISAYPPDQFIMLEKGATYGTRNNQIWAPYYTLHKILAGLLDCYEVGGNKKALEIAQGMGQWVHARLKPIPDATRISMWNRYIAGEYGGMNEVLARLSRLSGDKSFLEAAKLFDNINFFYGGLDHNGGLIRNVDTLRGKHANQHIPQITGALETYRDTKEGDYWKIADNFWEMANHSYTYSIGGVAGAKNNGEMFTAQPDSLFVNGFANNQGNETCATYNMLKLSRQLFMFDQDPRYMDYYEQALYNDILASVAENDAGNTYHIPLNPAARKQFGNPRMTGFTCCNGTALESNTKLQDSIYFRSADNKTLYVNLYVPSKVTWTGRKASITQKTDYPYGDTTKLTVGGGGDFALKVRVPGWATHGFTVAINGSRQLVEATPGTYLTLSRAWKDGDVVALKMPFGFHLSTVMDQPNLASLFYGPVLLAAEENEPRATWRPIVFDARDIAKSVTGEPQALRFKSGDATFKPFYETYGRHSVYLDVTFE
jgi:DUF1680 family protein